MKICDPLYDYIHLDSKSAGLVSHPVFQRLRAIRQLGFSDNAFPSATHNRFSHSLGVCHLAGLAFDSIFSKNKALIKESKKEAFRKTVRMAGLLHDIGHGPLSHSSECLMPPLKSLALEKFLNSKKDRSARHEDYSILFIMDEKRLYRELKEAGVEPEAVALLLHPEFAEGHDFFKEGGLDFLPLLRQIVSSDFDVDRMDYLYRDSLFCGVKYGLIDFTWLISHFDCHIEQDQVFLAIGQGALCSLESLILGRQHMRMIVYFHHKSASYNQMLKNYAKDCKWRLSSDISSYMSMVDSVLFEKLKSDDNPWARRIINHKPYLRLYEFSSSEDLSEQDQYMLSLKENLKKKKIDFIEINSTEHSIKPHKSSIKKYQIYLKNRAVNQVQLLNKGSSVLFSSSRRIKRIYVEPDSFEEAKWLFLEK